MKIVKTALAIPILSLIIPSMVQANDNELQFEVALHALNSSGVYGKAEATLKKGNMLKISIEANGLETNRPHPQHIHGLDDSSLTATCPELDADVDADGLVSVGEGFPFYGPIVLPLTPFDLVNNEGELRYEATFTINPDSIQDLDQRTIVLHGMSVNGQYIPSLPVACGEFNLE